VAALTWPGGSSGPLPVRIINAYVDWELTAADRDPAVAAQFLRVASLQDPAVRLFRPSTALRVVLGNLRRSPNRRSTPPQA
jgi:hypothetical protein